MALSPQVVSRDLSPETAASDAVLQSAIRKAALRFVPLLTIAYLFNYLDRTSLGFAALTMNKQLGLSAGEFGLAAGIFFLAYSTCEIPSNLMLYRFGARRWLARIMISWGLVSALNALVIGPNSFYAVRLLLGVAEAGFFPGVTFFLAAWFPAQYRTRMLAWFLIGIPASALVGGPLCGMLLQMDGIWGLAGWQWLFIMVSIPCIPLGFLTLYLLADNPQSASWLTPQESDVLRHVLATEVRERPHSSLLAALKDVRVLVCAAIQFGFTLGSYGIGIWLPLILKEYHLTNLSIGWISAIPYLFASIGMIVWARYVDRTGHRLVNLAIACLLGGIGLARADPVGIADGGADRVHRGADRRLGGAGGVLDGADKVPDRHGGRRRPRLHQQHRHGRRFRRTVDDGLAEGVFRLLCVRAHRGRGDHGRLDAGVAVAETRSVERIAARQFF